MTQFVGTHFGKRDAKGRISVPAPFRAELEAAATNQLVFRVSHQHPCIEARSRTVFQHMLDSILSLEHFSEDREALEAGIIADSMALRIDGEGRLVLPDEMVEEVGLKGEIAFLGKGDRFEIWDAEAARAHVAAAKKLVRERRLTIAAMPLNTNPKSVP
ncbi:cell division/cell wall cluster transcriptional repressor MraZ [Roseomonas stagni]|uniref:Transcriptional regulator MraZ n=1 Tax=Falsiroseomonas algicola TaxID=2716930 RepID=A0A6M1LI64_9PROT|nr:cell division/cell wall cluster transcriptional repressor MraZ [Falsiroseomonas algicola]NGM19970.1 cell division/cell wall cluster transcriptional repressor MraZ [Falsiroseomonas algicola]